jgi:Uma2 family endonuclease
MATIAGRKLITAEEFIRMPDPLDGSRQELVRGVIETMPPPGTRHGVCCSKIDRRLGNFVEEQDRGTVASNDCGFVSERDPDTVRGPDISFWSKERLPEVPDGYAEVPPDLAVEVASPTDHHARLMQRVHHHLTHGVRLVWVVDPEDRSMIVYRSLQDMKFLQENDLVSGEDVLPGFSCRVADLLP